jgi:hypothetical protein
MCISNGHVPEHQSLISYTARRQEIFRVVAECVALSSSHSYPHLRYSSCRCVFYGQLQLAAEAGFTPSLLPAHPAYVSNLE